MGLPVTVHRPLCFHAVTVRAASNQRGSNIEVTAFWWQACTCVEVCLRGRYWEQESKWMMGTGRQACVLYGCREGKTQKTKWCLGSFLRPLKYFGGKKDGEIVRWNQLNICWAGKGIRCEWELLLWKVCVKSDSLGLSRAEGRANDVEEYWLGPEIGVLEKGPWTLSRVMAEPWKALWRSWAGTRVTWRRSWLVM